MTRGYLAHDLLLAAIVAALFAYASTEWTQPVSDERTGEPVVLADAGVTIRGGIYGR